MASQKFLNIWDALSDTAEEAANLRACAELMRPIAALIRRRGWTQAEAGDRAGILQPRASDLMNGRIHKLSLDALVQIAVALGLDVHIRADEREPVQGVS